jgi:hypothetical protein
MAILSHITLKLLIVRSKIDSPKARLSSIKTICFLRVPPGESSNKNFKITVHYMHLLHGCKTYYHRIFPTYLTYFK